jgi:hypothetical protein
MQRQLQMRDLAVGETVMSVGQSVPAVKSEGAHETKSHRVASVNSTFLLFAFKASCKRGGPLSNATA